MDGKFMNRQLRGPRLAVAEAALIVVLAALRHQEQMSRHLLPQDILRHFAENPSLPGQFAGIIPENLSVDGFRKGVLRHAQPVRFRHLRRQTAQPLPIILLQAEYPVPASAHGGHLLPVKAHEFGRQLCIGSFQQKSRTPVHGLLPGQEKAEPRFKIMIPGNLVVKAVAFGTASRQRGRGQMFNFRKLLMNHCGTAVLVIGSGKLKPSHESPSPFP